MSYLESITKCQPIELQGRLDFISLLAFSQLSLPFLFHLYLINIEIISLGMTKYLQPVLSLTCSALVSKKGRDTHDPVKESHIA